MTSRRLELLFLLGAAAALVGAGSVSAPPTEGGARLRILHAVLLMPPFAVLARALAARWLGPLPGGLGQLGVLWLIGGVLFAIAIPPVDEFRCKSKQSEAKTNLSGVFTAERAFSGEYGTYSSDLLSVNWGPDGAPLYLYGFARPGPGAHLQSNGLSGYDERRKDTAHLDDRQFSHAKMRDLSGHPLLPSDLPESATAENARFLAAAVGDIDPGEGRGGPVRLDVWTIDDQRQLTNLRNDCTGAETPGPSR